KLQRRGIGDVTTLTVREYLALSRWRRLGYRLYRNPLVMFGLGPAYLFIVMHRLPIGLVRGGWQPWLSTMATNATIAVIILAMIWLVGAGPFLLGHVPVPLLAASIGVWLFYVQHQFADTFGPRLLPGPCTKQRFTAALIRSFLASSVGSLPTSECTTCITSAVD